MNGMAVGNPGMAAFQNPNNTGPQVRANIPNGMYATGGPTGVSGGNMGAFTAANPQLRGIFPPQIQHQIQQQQHQQNQIAAAQQFTMSQAAAQGNPQASAMNMPQQGQQMQLTSLQAQHALAAQQRAAVASAAQYVHCILYQIRMITRLC
jgi:hypothetical protein